MKIHPTLLQNSYVIELEPFIDERGKFIRLFCQNELQEIHQGKSIQQINYSLTVKKGAVRGMHFQYPPAAEVKLVHCIRGKVFDVIIDLRKESPTFLNWHSEILSEENKKMLYIPEGCAHGFQTLEENCEMLYFHTEFYSPSHEGGIRYNEPAIKIQWPLEPADISKRDDNHPLLNKDFSGIAL